MYHNVDEFESAITNFAAAHPTIAEKIVLPEQSADRDARRTISCLRIGSNAAGAADGALLIFGQHAREWVPPEIGLNLMADLLSSYSGDHPLTYGTKTYTAAQVREIVDNINIFIVPCVNPDGRLFTQSIDDDLHRFWRRNRSKEHSSTASCQGVDLNRNYDIMFDLNRYFDTTGTSVLDFTSPDPCNSNQVYHGPSGFSEPETRNIRWLVETYPRIRWFVDTHGHKSEIYHPWGDDENQSADAAMNFRNTAFDGQRGGAGDTTYREYIRPADLATHVSLANRIKDGIAPSRGSSYLVMQMFALYPTSGSAAEYMWSRHLVNPSLPRIESFSIEVAGGMSDRPIVNGFQPLVSIKDEIVREVTSGLINFCLSAVCGVPGVTATLVTTSVVFNKIPEGRVSSRPVILQVTGCEGATFRVVSGPTRTGGSTRVNFGVAVATKSVPAAGTVVTRDLYLWLTAEGGLAGDNATGTARVECPETGQTFDVAIMADFARVPRASAVLVLDRSGSMSSDGGDGRTRLQVLLDSAPAFVEVAPPNTRVGLVRFATDESPGAPMTNFGPEGPDPGGRQVIRDAIAGHTLATGDASWTSIGDGVFAANALIDPVADVEFKALVVLTDGHENRSRFLSDVSSLINDRVFAIGLGTPEQIEPIALDTLTNGTGGYMLMTGTLDADDPFRLAKYYLQILTGVTNDQVVLDPDGWLPFGGQQSIPFYLNEADQSVDTILLIPFPKMVRVRLRTPGGVILDETSPAVKWTTANQIGFYRFTLPVPGAFSSEGPGRWEILLDWQKNWKKLWDREKNEKRFAATTGRNALRYKALVHARSDLAMTAVVGQTSLTPGATVTVRVKLTQYESIPVEHAKVRAVVRFPDGSEVKYFLPTVAEGIYETAFAANLSGTYTIRITAEGRSLRGAPFTREAVRTAIVWPGGDREPPRTDGDCWCRTIRCLIETKAIDPEMLKRLGINSDGLLRCCPPDEPEGKIRSTRSAEARRSVASSGRKKVSKKISESRRKK